MKKHVLITGTGRAGTTLIVELLTKLGLDTGYRVDNMSKDMFELARAGLETPIDSLLSGNAPYIVKSPWFCDHMDQLLNSNIISIEHVILPIRDIKAAARSRVFVSDAYKSETKHVNEIHDVHQNQVDYRPNRIVPGGLWYAENVEQQEMVLHEKLMNLLLALSKKQVPVTLINYPMLTNDPIYLYQKLKPIIKGVSQERFIEIFDITVLPKLVHSFTGRDR